jgi:AcrR family transcriptional regulator
LAEARRILVAEGPNALSTRRIAKAVGCTATALYLYFENKEALVHALIDEGFLRLQTALDAAWDGPEGAARLERVARAYVDFGLANPEYYQVMFQLAPAGIETYPVEKYRRNRQGLELLGAALAQARSESAPGRSGSGFSRDPDGPVDSEALVSASVLWTTLHGLVALLVSRRIDHRVPERELIRHCLQHALALADRPPARDATSLRTA